MSKYVRYVNEDGDPVRHITLGKIYKVWYTYYIPGHEEYTQVESDDGTFRYYFSWRFQPVDSPDTDEEDLYV